MGWSPSKEENFDRKSTEVTLPTERQNLAQWHVKVKEDFYAVKPKGRASGLAHHSKRSPAVDVLQSIDP